MSGRPKHVLFISYYFPPCGGSGVLRMVRFVKNMAAFDRTPFVLTVDERDIPLLGYGTIQSDTSYADVGRSVAIERVRLARPSTAVVRSLKSIRRLFSGLRTHARETSPTRGRGIPASETVAASAGATDVEGGLQKATTERESTGKPRIRDYHSSDVNPILKFIFEIVLIIDQIFEWAPAAAFRGIRCAKKNDIDVIFSSSPPWSAHIVGYLVKIFRRKKWIMDLRDPVFGIDTPELQTRESPWIIRAFYRVLESIFMRGADAVVCNCDEIRRYYENKYPRTTFTAITNSFDPDDYIGIVPKEKTDDTIVISHFGELYPTIRTPDRFLEALADVVREEPRVGERVLVEFYGSTEYVRSGAFLDLVDRLDLAPMIRNHEYVPHSEITARMMEADLLLLLQPHHSTNYQIPAKLFEYITAGRPVLAIAPDGSATSNLVRDHGLGMACDPVDTVSIVNAIKALLDRSLPVPKRAAVDRFSARQMAGKLIEVMDTL